MKVDTQKSFGDWEEIVTKRHLVYYLLILFAWADISCQATRIAPTRLPLLQPTPSLVVALTEGTGLPLVHATSTPTKAAPPSATSSPTFLPPPSGTPSSTLVMQIDISRFDPDLDPPIEVSHNPPLIARSDETVNLIFNIFCPYNAPRNDFRLYVALFFAYGEENNFISIPLKRKTIGGMAAWQARLPATNAEGALLRYYYLQVIDPQAGVDVRYPLEGAIDLFTASDFIPIDLPVEKQAVSGEVVLLLPWGNGPEEDGMREREGYPFREGPLAIDVAEDGRIALLDHINGRVLLYNPADKSFTSIPLSFNLHSQGDVQFDRNGQVAVFDPVGEPIDGSNVRIPQLYRLLPDGQIDSVAPVFAVIPSWWTKDLEVVDLDYSKLVAPFSRSGEVNSREAQRQKQPAELLAKYMTHSVHEVRLADPPKGIAFEVRSESPLGAITYFEKTPIGYVAVFEGDKIRAIWFDASGIVLKDFTLPRDDYSEINSLGRISMAVDGSLYVLESEEKGILIRFVKAPGY